MPRNRGFLVEHDEIAWSCLRSWVTSQDWNQGNEGAGVAVSLPKYNDFHWPAVVALRELGDSATIEEFNAQVISDQGFTEEQQAVIHKDGPMTAIEYRLAWARTYLKGMGLATNSERGVWTLTLKGRTVTEDEIKPLRNEYLARMRKASEAKSDADDSPACGETDKEAWREELLDEVMKLGALVTLSWVADLGFWAQRRVLSTFWTVEGSRRIRSYGVAHVQGIRGRSRGPEHGDRGRDDRGRDHARA
jgi:hypothetical protein